MQRKSAKVLATEKWVDAYTEMNRRPPTYKEIQEAFGIGKCAAYARCSKFRHKMSQHTKPKKILSPLEIDEILLKQFPRTDTLGGILMDLPTNNYRIEGAVWAINNIHLFNK